MQSTTNNLFIKINAFIKKYYLNQILRGFIYTLSVLLLLYLFLFLISYYINPIVEIKTILFFFFIFSSLFLFIVWVLKPILAYLKWVKPLTLEQAAKIIGVHFAEVKDKLTNAIQLQSLADLSAQNQQLLLASIDQKTNELKDIQFTNAVNLKENIKHLKYVFTPLLVILLIALVAPIVLQEGTYRFVKYDTVVLPKPPFDFVLLNRNLRVVEGEDVVLNLRLQGDEIPQDVYLQEGENSYKLEKKQKNEFQHTIKNIQKPLSFKFLAGGFLSQEYVISTNPNPRLQNVEATLIFPNYLAKASQKITNVGDLTIPEGTVVHWKFNTQNSSSLVFLIADKKQKLLLNKNQALAHTRLYQNSKYSVYPENKFVQSKDSISHQITVIKDQYPSISISQKVDSLSNRYAYFSGKISDDYGFSKLICFYQIQENNKTISAFYKPIKINNQQTENLFLHILDYQSFKLKENQTLVYYFEVADNDGVNGAKKIRSEIKYYQPLTTQQLVEKIGENQQNIKQKIERAVKNASNLESESKKIREQILDKNELSYEDQKKLNALKEKQNKLEKNIKELQEINKKNTEEKKENNFLNKELAEKQKKIDELLEKVLDEKLKNKDEKIQDFTKPNDEIQNQIEKSQQDNKLLKNELDRILELYKQLEFEQDLEKSIERISDLSEQQNQLSKKTKQQKSNTNDLKAKQENLNKSFEEIKKSIENLEKKNEQLEKPNDFKAPEKEIKKVDEEQQKSEEELNKKNKEKASENQKSAGDALEKLAKKMRSIQQAIEEEKNLVDEKSLRSLIATLMKTSFEQEKILLDLNTPNLVGKQYLTVTQRQHNIKMSIKNITDSLFSLSKRVPEIETKVNQELQKINSNVELALTKMADKKLDEASKHQHFALTSINNLSLMLNESLENARKSNKKSGSGSPSQNLKSLKKMQEQLNENMKLAKQQMQQNNGSVPKESLSKSFAKMAQQQQMIREALQKINRENNKNGKNPLGDLNTMIEEMKRNEVELVNKRLSQQMMERQKDLLVKFLEAENAENEQQQDSKREASAAKDFPPSYKKMIEKFNKDQQQQTEQLQKMPVNLNQYYKNKVKIYYQLLNKTP